MLVNYCGRVGNGMTDAELQTVREKLNPYFVPYAQKPKNYKVTTSKKVQPDMWVKDVSKSIVLQVSSFLEWVLCICNYDNVAHGMKALQLLE